MEVTLAQELNPRKAGSLVKAAAIIVLFIVTYLPVLSDLHAKYSEIDSYYSHGYLIPLVSAFAVWHQRKKLKDMRVVPCRPGLLVLAGGLLLYLLGRWWYVNFVSALSMLVVLAGVVLYLFGKAIIRALVFPLAFLLFMIPLPKLTIIYVTFWLKLLAASIAAEVAGVMGIPVFLQGAFIELPNAVLEIDNACSGLRSMIALTALGVAYAHFLRLSLLKKCVFVLVSIPIAFVANLLRIVTLILVSYLYGPGGKAFERADFTTGLLIFVIAFIGLYVVSKGVIAWEERRMARCIVG